MKSFTGKTCPVCKQKTLEGEEDVHVWCTNTRCPYMRNYEFERRHQSIFDHRTPEEWFSTNDICPKCKETQSKMNDIHWRLRMYRIMVTCSILVWLVNYLG